MRKPRKRKERPRYAFVRKGDSLVPEMEYDLGALTGIAQNEAVLVDIEQGRSNPRLRAYWAMLRECVDATGCALNSEALHEAVKLHTGHVTTVKLRNGMCVGVAKSIAFDSISEAEMVRFFRAAEQWLAAEYGFAQEERKAA